jgi:hypothetical protein
VVRTAELALFRVGNSKQAGALEGITPHRRACSSFLLSALELQLRSAARFAFRKTVWQILTAQRTAEGQPASLIVRPHANRAGNEPRPSWLALREDAEGVHSSLSSTIHRNRVRRMSMRVDGNCSSHGRFLGTSQAEMVWVPNGRPGSIVEAARHVSPPRSRCVVVAVVVVEDRDVSNDSPSNAGRG